MFAGGGILADGDMGGGLNSRGAAFGGPGDWGWRRTSEYAQLRTVMSGAGALGCMAGADRSRSFFGGMSGAGGGGFRRGSIRWYGTG